VASGPARRGRANGRRTRQRLIANAIALWSERGSLGVTVSAVAERSGTARRTVYHHFPTHEALIAATVESIDIELAKLAGGEVGPGSDPYEFVPTLAADNPELIRSVLSRLLVDDPLENSIFVSGVRYWHDQAREHLNASVPPEHAAAITIAMWYGANLIVSTKATPEERRREAERFARTFKQLLFHGILSRQLP